MIVARIVICPECGNEVEEFTTFDVRGFILENHAFCADSGGGDCLWGGAYPDNSRNIKNNKLREQRKLAHFERGGVNADDSVQGICSDQK